MITRNNAELLERLIGKLEGMHAEITALCKKSSSDAVNRFKLGFINPALAQCNELLGKGYQPLESFTGFNVDDVPSNSDVGFVIAQYLEALEKLRSHNVKLTNTGWQYDLPSTAQVMRAAPPGRSAKRK